MPREKKDGRFINYYIDRSIYERLKRYADRKGQPMTTAIERILEEYLDKHEPDEAIGGNMMYCDRCCIVFPGSRCPQCGSKKVRNVEMRDYCFLAEKETIWAEALKDLLKENKISFVTRNALGAGLAAKMGPAMERVRFYVPYGSLGAAQALERGFFAEQDSK